MEERKIAFVLKKLNHANSYVPVLTMNEGKRNLIFRKIFFGIKICPGMLISFTKIEQNQNWLCLDVEILACFVNNSYSDICFIHHILEICYYFAPYHKPCVEVFAFLCDTLTFMRKHDISHNFLLVHKVFVIKLLSMFGFCSYNKISRCLAVYDKLTFSFIDFTHAQKLEFLKNQLASIDEKDLDVLIMEGLREHPNFCSFKTLAFLYGS
ncbi:MAG: hypothetical protein US49_C0001G0118 [candidate division TM6 bacterium GW2011_GWF2_37_49]|nr:MAG: hypothetical protein US49_C0001G0118 [candidate division TM6 bacterium GW2011_GWF2_37_49]